MKKIIKQFAKVALGATFLFATMLTVIPVKALNCKDVNVIFMRGSSQNYTPHDNEDVNFPVWTINRFGEVEFDDYRYNKNDDKEPAFVTSEREGMTYFKSIGDRVHKDYPGLTMQFVSLHDFAGKYNSNGYKAVSAFGPASHAFVSRNAIDAKFGSYEVVNEAVYGDYNQSVSDGAEELAGYLQDQMVSCPSQMNIVGGFSQGAHVVGEAMQKMHDRGQDNLLSRLGHVDLYGDPKFNGFELTTNRLNPLQKHSTLPWARGSATVNHVGSLGPRKPYVPDILTSKTTSWCDFNDLVCGGYAGLAINYDAHGEVYDADEGWIKKSANEIYVDIKTRLALLAGLTDTSANSPLAFWNGIKHPKKLDVMFVMDRTGDESLSLIPDPNYIAFNMIYLSEVGLTSSRVGVNTFTEFGRYDGTKTLIESVVKTPVNLTSDFIGDYGYFKSAWGPAHFQNPPYGGEDLQDSPYKAIDSALDQGWRSDARKVIVIFSNTWGKDKEDTTNLTMKDITAKARAKDVEILPIFTSKTFRANPDRVQNIPKANAFYTSLSKGASGHYTEVTDKLPERLIFDVIMGHVHAPDVEIMTGKVYNTPATTTKKAPASTTIKNTKPVFKKAKKVVLSAAAKSNSPKSKIKTFAWDLNGDGVIDETSTLPDIEHIYDAPFNGTISVDVTDEAGNTTTGYQDIEVTDDDAQVTHQEPTLLTVPTVGAQRSGNDVILAWPPTEGDLTIANADGAVMVTTNGMSGTLTLKDVPQTAFSIFVQRHLGVDVSDPAEVAITAAPMAVAAIVVPDPVVPVLPDPALTDIANQTSLLAVVNSLTSPTPQATAEVLGASVVATQELIKQPTTTLAVNAKPAATNAQTIQSAVSQKNNFKLPSLPKINFSKVAAKIIGAGVKLKLIFSLIFRAIWPDVTILLLFLVLLLILLDMLSRDRKNKQYKHDKQYTYSHRKTNPRLL